MPTLGSWRRSPAAGRRLGPRRVDDEAQGPETLDEGSQRGRLGGVRAAPLVAWQNEGEREGRVLGAHGVAGEDHAGASPPFAAAVRSPAVSPLTI